MTRVRKNLPPLTLRLSAAAVNEKSLVSTGFLRFFLVFLWKTRRIRVLRAGEQAESRCLRGLGEGGILVVQCIPAAGAGKAASG
jgi:hypothetical protein